MEHAYWKQMIEIEENGIFLFFGITRNDQIKFLHFSSEIGRASCRERV